MINIVHLAGFMVLAIKNKSGPVDEFKPVMKDAKQMGIEMDQFEVKIINGKKQYPFEQWAENKGYIRFLDNGQISVVSPSNWRNAGKTYELLQWIREKDMEQYFHANPEDREEHEKKISGIKSEISKLFGKMKEA